jgi:hypothetical protein
MILSRSPLLIFDPSGDYYAKEAPSQQTLARNAGDLAVVASVALTP